MAEHQLTCAHCGAQFVTGHKRKFCTALCREYAKREAKRIRLGREKRWPNGKPEPRKICVCIVCGVEFMPKAHDRTTCCGRKCGTLYAGFRTRAYANGCRVSVRVQRKKCPTCGRGHSKLGLYCQEQCRPSEYQPVVRATCRKCSREFVRKVDGYSAHYCTKECKDAARRDAARPAKKKRRAIERGANGGERVDVVRVFARDGWKCMRCGKPTPKERRGTYHPRAPELDHIVPVSLGGAHTYANTQCLCRQCNGTKGATIAGQLNLFPMG
jgi:5-methylcytosine-specific restriction endonuclease McrA